MNKLLQAMLLLLLLSCTQEKQTNDVADSAISLEKLKTLLKISSESSLNEVNKLLSSALTLSSSASEHISDKELDDFNKTMNAATSDPGKFEKAMRDLGQKENERLGASANREDFLVKASEIIRRERGELSDYESLKLTSHVFKTEYLKSPNERLKFSPQSKLKSPANVDIKLCPATGENYAPFLTNEGSSRYWEKESYRKLLQMAEGDLPDEAMEAVAYLSIVDATYLRREGYFEELAETLLKKYGQRAVPCAYKVLLEPEKFNIIASQRLQENNLNYSFLGRTFGTYFATLPQPSAEPYFRSALEAGWYETSAELPEADWAKALLTEFGDSPYGKPYDPLWNRK